MDEAIVEHYSQSSVVWFGGGGRGHALTVCEVCSPKPQTLGLFQTYFNF